MAYRHVNSRGVPYYLHGREVATAGGRVGTYYFLREERPRDAREHVPPGHAIVERPGVAREPFLAAALGEAAHAAQSAAGVPPYVLEVVGMVHCAFGGAPPREAYWPRADQMSPLSP